MAGIRDAARSPLTRFMALMLGGYVVLAWLTNAPDMLLVGNALMAAVAVAIMVAYAKPAAIALTSPTITRGGLLGLGIFLAWAGTAMFRMLTMAVYGLDLPNLRGTDYSTLALHLQFIAGCMHLAAPDLDDRGMLPPRIWVMAGLLSGGGVLLLAALILLRPYL